MPEYTIYKGKVGVYKQVFRVHAKNSEEADALVGAGNAGPPVSEYFVCDGGQVFTFNEPPETD